MFAHEGGQPDPALQRAYLRCTALNTCDLDISEAAAVARACSRVRTFVGCSGRSFAGWVQAMLRLQR